MRVRVFLTPLLFIYTACIPPGQGPAPDQRIIPVCILMDSLHAVDDSVVRVSAMGTFQEYRDSVHIDLREKERHFMSVDPDSSGIDIDKLAVTFISQAIKRCPQSELRVLFTQRTVVSDTLAGISYTEKGFLILFAADKYFVLRDGAGHVALISLFKHELGHLFGATHTDPDTIPFMFSRATTSHGAWTVEIRKTISANRSRSWFPYVTQTPRRQGVPITPHKALF